MSIQTDSRKALRELIDLLNEVDERWAGAEWNLMNESDVVAAHRALMHLIEGGIVGYFERDPAHPEFRRIVTPSRKFTGDNPDAIYYDAAIDDQHEYVVRGSMDGAVYVSITIEIGAGEGALAERTGGVINDTGFDVDAQGRFEIHLGGERRERGWLALEPGSDRITTRHYYEDDVPRAADPLHAPVLEIEVLGGGGPPAPPDDAAVAGGIRHVARFIRGRTLEMPPLANSDPPPFVSIVPNLFPQPVLPGDFGLAAFDAHYSMAPYVLGPDQALVITGRWPECRCANVCLWTRHQQTFDYCNRTVSLNRRQTETEADGSFRMLLAHRDPGVPNWIDTEGRPFGIVFWRFMLVEGEVVCPTAEVVPFTQVAGG
jgi:hypothetical protein